MPAQTLLWLAGRGQTAAKVERVSQKASFTTFPRMGYTSRSSTHNVFQPMTDNIAMFSKARENLSQLTLVDAMTCCRVDGHLRVENDGYEQLGE